MTTRYCPKFMAFNLSIASGSSGASGTFELESPQVQANHITVSSTDDFAVGIRIDRADGEYFKIAKGMQNIFTPTKRAIYYKVFSNTACEFSLMLARSTGD